TEMGVQLPEPASHSCKSTPGAGFRPSGRSPPVPARRTDGSGILGGRARNRPGFRKVGNQHMSTHPVTIGNARRELPIIDVGGVSVALLNLLGDTELTEAAAAELVKVMPEGIEVLVTPEVKAVPLAHAMSRLSGIPYVVARKTVKPYM